MSYYRALRDIDVGGEPIANGTLLYTWRASDRRDRPASHIAVSEQADGWGLCRLIPSELLAENPSPQAHELLPLLAFYMRGHDVPPHLELIEARGLRAGLDAIAYGGEAMTLPGRVLLPGFTRGEPGRAFLRTTQGGAFDGTAIVLMQRSRWTRPPAGLRIPRLLRFAICAHDKVIGSSANPSRGWNPGRCRICGLDLSVDSGD